MCIIVLVVKWGAARSLVNSGIEHQEMEKAQRALPNVRGHAAQGGGFFGAFERRQYDLGAGAAQEPFSSVLLLSGGDREFQFARDFRIKLMITKFLHSRVRPR